ncbi:MULTISPECIES: phage tail tip lysozyme [unclassified Collinsella]|uniref:phage tail tip lysozyme n=1 Tax=unclassified Collinsella TaxID=2637548 RepID=UPI001313EE1B|nr:MULTISPECIES: phage tail tip lysozyme [unclassified Collinsella]
MPDDSKYGNASSSSNLKDGSTASMSSAAERQQQAAAAYDDALQRTAGVGADFSRHVDAVSSGYSASADAASTPGAVSTVSRDAVPSAYSAGVMGPSQQTSGVEQGFVAAASQGPATPTAAQPIQQVPSAFTSRMEQQGTATPFAGGSDRAAAVRRNMMTSFDGIDAAGIAGSRDFIEGAAVSVQADSRDAFSSAYDAGGAGFSQPASGAGQSSAPMQGGQQPFGGASPVAADTGGAEEKTEAVSEAIGFGSHQGPSASWASADMFTGGKASDVHLSKKIQENLDNSRAAYSQAKQDFAAAEKDALETLDASGWNSGVQASAFSDSALRAEGFKDGLGTTADGIERAGVSDSRDFGFMNQAERGGAGGTAQRIGKPHSGDNHGDVTGTVSNVADAPDSVRAAARKVVAEKEHVRAASDDMVAAHREASAFITKAEQRAKTAAKFKSAAANALVNSATASIGDDSVSGTAVRSTARAAVAAGRSIRASRAAGKQAGARGFFSSSAEAAKSAVFAFDEEGSLDGIEKADEAVRAGRYVRGKARDFKAARAKAKGGSKSQLMSQAEKKAARAAEDGQRVAFSKSMQRRSMSIARAKAAAGEAVEAEQKAALIGKVTAGLKAAAQHAIAALQALLKSLAAALAGAVGSLATAIGGSTFGMLILAAVPVLILLLALSGGSADQEVQGMNEVESQVASFFREKGLDDLQIAAIMGNMYAESGMNPGSEEGGGTNANGIGLCQWTNGRHTNLVNYAKSVGKSWTEVQVQLDFFWDHDSWGYWSRAYTIRSEHGPDGSENRSLDPVGGTLVSGSKRAFLASTDLKDAVRQFCYGWEGAGIPRLKVRYEAADRYYELLTNPSDGDGDHGGGTGAPQIAGASARQQTVVNMAYATPSPGQGWCAAWVTNVFRAAGVGYFGGNACDMCRSWCHSSNRSELKVGMIIADVSHPGTGAPGLTYGHVGIYIGNNKVMSNEGPITVKSLDTFIRFYGAGTGCKWGWIGGIDISK